MSTPDPNRWTLEQLRDGGWACTESVELVTMPCCGFTYEASSAHEDGSFTCPACAERVLLEAAKLGLEAVDAEIEASTGGIEWAIAAREKLRAAIALAEGREPAP